MRIARSAGADRRGEHSTDFTASAEPEFIPTPDSRHPDAQLRPIAVSFPKPAFVSTPNGLRRLAAGTGCYRRQRRALSHRFPYIFIYTNICIFTTGPLNVKSTLRVAPDACRHAGIFGLQLRRPGSGTNMNLCAVRRRNIRRSAPPKLRSRGAALMAGPAIAILSPPPQRRQTFCGRQSFVISTLWSCQSGTGAEPCGMRLRARMAAISERQRPGNCIKVA